MNFLPILLAALSQIESGDNDHAIGSHFEVSRYQIMPALWSANATSLCEPTNTVCASEAAERIWLLREGQFFKTHHRQPTAREWYLLWHCPARVDGPTPADLEIAGRFQNLVEAGI